MQFNENLITTFEDIEDFGSKVKYEDNLSEFYSGIFTANYSKKMEFNILNFINKFDDNSDDNSHDNYNDSPCNFDNYFDNSPCKFYNKKKQMLLIFDNKLKDFNFIKRVKKNHKNIIIVIYHFTQNIKRIDNVASINICDFNIDTNIIDENRINYFYNDNLDINFNIVNKEKYDINVYSNINTNINIKNKTLTIIYNLIFNINILNKFSNKKCMLNLNFPYVNDYHKDAKLDKEIQIEFNKYLQYYNVDFMKIIELENIYYILPKGEIYVQPFTKYNSIETSFIFDTNTKELMQIKFNEYDFKMNVYNIYYRIFNEERLRLILMKS